MNDKKDDDEGDMNLPYQNLEKGVILQEKGIFNKTPLNIKGCCDLLTKILVLINRGETFNPTEATDLFFAVTKLFQSHDQTLRRIVYLVLKELTPFTESSIIIISSLTKDMNSKIDNFRSNSTRVLTGILKTDSSLLVQAERNLKQLVVDKEPYVASSALVSGYHLSQTPSGSDVVKRWFNEIQTALKGKDPNAQHHALGLLYQIRKSDRLSVSKLVTTVTSMHLSSSYANCLLIRLISFVISDDDGTTDVPALFDYLDKKLSDKSESVMYEAARAICNLPNVTSRELTPAISVLQFFLSSSHPTLRFAAIRTLNKVAQNYASSVATCNLDMETLVTDSNRSIATLSITTLLKTGSESSVERLMKQIGSFMNEINDEFKIVVVEAIKGLCLKFPSKQSLLLNFLANMLRDEGGFLYKKKIVESIFTIIESQNEMKEEGLGHLCEFIEDCEYSFLSTKILHLLGEEGPKTTNPSKYIRYIYNRVILENSSVRAAAVSALSNFALHVEDLRPSIQLLLERCIYDNDNEVRDRSVLSFYSINQDVSFAKKVHAPVPFASLNKLSTSLQQYLSKPTSSPFEFDLASFSSENAFDYNLFVQSSSQSTTSQNFTSTSNTSSSGSSSSSQSKSGEGDNKNIRKDYVELINSIPEFKKLGKILSSSTPQALTESESEYVVSCIKHFYSGYILFHFICKNTIEEQQLENVSVRLEADDQISDSLTLVSTVQAKKLRYGSTSHCFVCFEKEESSFPTGSFTSTLKFVMKEVDGDTGEPDEDDQGYEDEFQLDDLELSASNYICKSEINNDWNDVWEQLGESAQKRIVFSLPNISDLSAACTEIINYLSLQPCNQSHKVPPKKNKHVLYLAGSFLGLFPIVVRARMKLDDNQANVEIVCRSSSEEISQMIISII
eukprot:TRINITY_DN6512_c0_g1_i1.p1 TRINITY_DN6512_c0_g1~~TRINITY_DN6512_c0_g1_i1.p1  ORF type:complete len:903 (-),score=286.64 TRINITY_DN6512_c0_g1_i1:47-2755(-)